MSTILKPSLPTSGWQDIDAGLDDTYFVWIGGTTTNDPIYYRVFNPAVWIEFNNEGGVASGGRRRGGRDRSDGRSRGGLDHVHSITRAPNGKDYGIFALNQGPKTLLEHYVLEDHHKVSDELFDYRITDLQNREHMEAR